MLTLLMKRRIRRNPNKMVLVMIKKLLRMKKMLSHVLFHFYLFQN
jgi:hypothetical protein